MYVCMYVCICPHALPPTNAHTYAHPNIYKQHTQTYTHTHTHAHTHTHIHTHSQEPDRSRGGHTNTQGMPQVPHATHQVLGTYVTSSYTYVTYVTSSYTQTHKECLKYLTQRITFVATLNPKPKI